MDEEVSNAVLLGVAAYSNPELPEVPAARNSLAALRQVLTDPALCGWSPDDVHTIEDPSGAGATAKRINDAARRTSGVFLLYYVGHGSLTAQAELCLCVTGTDPDVPLFTGIPFQWLARILRECPARVKILILDCCFSGQAIEALAPGDGTLADVCHVEGVYTLTATTRNRPAHVPPLAAQSHACTSFTQELTDLVREGLTGPEETLTLGRMFPQLRLRLASKGLPQPSQRDVNTVSAYAFTKNAAFLPIADLVSPTKDGLKDPSASDEANDSKAAGAQPGKARSRSALLEVRDLRPLEVVGVVAPGLILVTAALKYQDAIAAQASRLPIISGQLSLAMLLIATGLCVAWSLNAWRTVAGRGPQMVLKELRPEGRRARLYLLYISPLKVALLLTFSATVLLACVGAAPDTVAALNRLESLSTSGRVLVGAVTAGGLGVLAGRLFNWWATAAYNGIEVTLGEPGAPSPGARSRNATLQISQVDAVGLGFLFATLSVLQLTPLAARWVAAQSDIPVDGATFAAPLIYVFLLVLGRNLALHSSSIRGFVLLFRERPQILVE